MPRKKSVEVLPVESVPPTRDRKKTLREARHTITYNEQIPVELDPDQDDANIIDIESVEIEDKPKKRAKNQREELRKKLVQYKVTPESGLTMTIDRYLHSESSLRGVQADFSHCTRYACTESHILNEDYLEIARKYGAGLYRFTVRTTKPAGFVEAWDRRIEAAPSGPIIQNSIPGDPNSPQVIFQMPENTQAQPTVIDPTRYIKEQSQAIKQQLENYKMMREVFGPAVDSQEHAPRSEDDILAGAIVKQPAVIESVVNSVIKRFGKGDSGTDDPSPWAVAMRLVETGQAAQIVKTFMDSLFNGFRGMIPGGQNNGQAQMVQTQFPQGQHPGTQTNTHPQAGQETLEGHQSSVPATAPHDSHPYSAHTQATQQVSPEEQALALVINHCSRKLSPKITYRELIDMEQRLDAMLNQHAMQTGQILSNQIALYLDIFADMTPDEALEVVKTLPNGEQVASLPHAKDWTESLQKLIRESQDGGEE